MRPRVRSDVRGLAGLLTVLGLCARAARAGEPLEYAARHVLVSYAGSQGPPSTRTKAEARARAEEALAALKKPRSEFAAVSRAFSDDKAADAWGGFLGMLGPDALDPAFRAAIAPLGEGETSGVVETPFGFHVIQRMADAEGRRALASMAAAVYAASFPYRGAAAAAPGEQRTREQALADATRASAWIAGGTPFADLPKAVPAVPVQRDWVFPILFASRSAPELQAVEKAAFALEVGQTSAPVDSPYGLLVLKRRAWFHVHAQHVLVMHATSEMHLPQIRRTKEEAYDRAREARGKAEADPRSWPKVVAAFSDEPAAAEHDGSVGAVEPGAMDARFEAALLRLPPGGVSDVVETDFGFHVIRRLD